MKRLGPGRYDSTAYGFHIQVDHLPTFGWLWRILTGDPEGGWVSGDDFRTRKGAEEDALAHAKKIREESLTW